MEESRPVAATVCWKCVWMRPSGAISPSNPSIVVRNLFVSRIRRSWLRTGCWVFSNNHSRDSASVVKPVLIFLVLGSLSSSKRTTCNCLGDATLNSWPTAAYAARVSRSTSATKNFWSDKSFSLSTQTPRRSMTARSCAIGSSSFS
ncbi:unannotated protein [freshwater metagenome]|uniref:Unannotated protein n=1 Tax=freshwater metagenome TaxID=449393 RepID=A0A6J6VIR1_9ZZZZ